MAVAVADRRPLATGLSRSRWMKDRVFSAFLLLCAALALVPLVVIAMFVVVRGVSALNINFFTKLPPGPLDPPHTGGIANAIVGTGMIVGLAVVLSVPLGIATAIYLSEYGRGRIATVVRFTANTLLATPSIIAGLVVAATVVTWTHSFSAYAASLAISILMWPVVTRATEEVLRLVPQELREGALALGLPRWKVVVKIVIPTAGSGILTGVMLAVSRGLGETAAILLTALGNSYMNTSYGRPTASITLDIYSWARQPQPVLQELAWGAALTLMTTVLVLSIAARVVSIRRQRRLA
ncbi:MAG: phosphate transport system permease protein [Actinomycetota bacterium]|nr:phosphate transport system permease protein [Actinomycetota bacterium]